jgi:hypothetical protein
MATKREEGVDRRGILLDDAAPSFSPVSASRRVLRLRATLVRPRLSAHSRLSGESTSLSDSSYARLEPSLLSLSSRRVESVAHSLKSISPITLFVDDPQRSEEFYGRVFEVARSMRTRIRLRFKFDNLTKAGARGHGPDD